MRSSINIFLIRLIKEKIEKMRITNIKNERDGISMDPIGIRRKRKYVQLYVKKFDSLDEMEKFLKKKTPELPKVSKCS